MDPRSGAHTVSGEPAVPGKHFNKHKFCFYLLLEHISVYSLLSPCGVCDCCVDSHSPPCQN